MTVLRVTRDGSVATVRIDRPPANAVDPAMIEEFLVVLPPLAADPEVRCIVITGTGRFFVAGADIAVMRDLSEENQAAMRRWIEVQRAIELAPKPVIAGMNGQINIDYSVIAASGFLGALPAVLLVLCFQKYLVQGLTAGSVKG